MTIEFAVKHAHLLTPTLDRPYFASVPPLRSPPREEAAGEGGDQDASHRTGPAHDWHLCPLNGKHSLPHLSQRMGFVLPSCSIAPMSSYRGERPQAKRTSTKMKPSAPQSQRSAGMTSSPPGASTPARAPH